MHSHNTVFWTVIVQRIVIQIERKRHYGIVYVLAGDFARMAVE